MDRKETTVHVMDLRRSKRQKLDREMKAKMLEYNIMKSRKMSVLHVLVYLRMMLIRLSGLNVPTKTVVYGLMQSAGDV